MNLISCRLGFLVCAAVSIGIVDLQQMVYAEPPGKAVLDQGAEWFARAEQAAVVVKDQEARAMGWAMIAAGYARVENTAGYTRSLAIAKKETAGIADPRVRMRVGFALIRACFAADDVAEYPLAVEGAMAARSEIKSERARTDAAEPLAVMFAETGDLGKALEVAKTGEPGFFLLRTYSKMAIGLAGIGAGDSYARCWKEVRTQSETMDAGPPRSTIEQNLVTAQCRAGDSAGAMLTAKSISDADYRAESLLTIARAMIAAGDKDGARRAIEDAAIAAKQSLLTATSLLSDVAMAYAELGDKEMAMKLLGARAADSAGNVTALFCTAGAYARLGDFESSGKFTTQAEEAVVDRVKTIHQPEGEFAARRRIVARGFVGAGDYLRAMMAAQAIKGESVPAERPAMFAEVGTAMGKAGTKGTAVRWIDTMLEPEDVIYVAVGMAEGLKAGIPPVK